MNEEDLQISEIAQKISEHLANVSNNSGIAMTIAVVASALIAAFTLYYIRKNAKQQNALTILREYEADRDVIKEEAHYRKLKNKLFEDDPSSQTIENIAEKLRAYAQEDLEFTDDAAVLGALLNRFELIAACIRTGIIDEVLIRTWMQKYFVKHVCELSEFIKINQKKNMVAYSELHWLSWLWSDIYPEYRTIINVALGKPNTDLGKLSPWKRAIRNNWPILVLFVIQIIFFFIMVFFIL